MFNDIDDREKKLRRQQKQQVDKDEKWGFFQRG